MSPGKSTKSAGKIAVLSLSAGFKVLQHARLSHAVHACEDSKAALLVTVIQPHSLGCGDTAYLAVEHAYQPVERHIAVHHAVIKAHDSRQRVYADVERELPPDVMDDVTAELMPDAGLCEKLINSQRALYRNTVFLIESDQAAAGTEEINLPALPDAREVCDE